MDIVSYSIGLTGVIGKFWLDSANYGRAHRLIIVNTLTNLRDPQKHDIAAHAESLYMYVNCPERPRIIGSLVLLMNTIHHSCPLSHLNISIHY
jgi:hypothetical protein